MKSITFLALVAVALLALAACAPASVPSNAPTTAATAAATQTAPASAPTLGTTPTTAATTAATSAATPAATSAATTAATTAATAAATSAATAAATSMAGPAPAQTITLVGTEFKFDPNQLTVKAGQRVRIVFQNKGTVDHELEVEDLKADNVVLDLSQAGNIPADQKSEVMDDAADGKVHPYAAAGGTATIDFTPTEAGTFDFACNLPGHKEQGMVGTMVVQP